MLVVCNDWRDEGISKGWSEGDESEERLEWRQRVSQLNAE